MRALLRAVIVGVPMLGSGVHAISAQRVGQASQTVTFRVIAVNRAMVSGGARLLPLRVTQASENAAPHKLPGGTYGITTTEKGKKIVLSLDKSLPLGYTMSVVLVPPPGAASQGPTSLETEGRDAIDDIPASSESDLPISYTLVRSADAGTVSGAERTLWMTIVSGP